MNKLLGLAHVCLPVLGLQAYVATLGFYAGAGDLNLEPSAFTASALDP